VRTRGRESRGIPVDWTTAPTSMRSNLSRVTARRYVEHLADSGVVGRGARYGAPGRPEVEFRWASTG
jgi:response regulator of citrate/malate metabolism